MKKIFYAMLLLFLGSAFSMNAQVTIGYDDPPHDGAVLELKSNSKGFLLPRIELNGPKVWSLDGDPVDGMVVFHTGNGALDRDVYVWMVDKWTKVSGCGCEEEPTKPCESVPIVTISSNLERTSITEGNLVVLTANVSGGGTLSYKWYKNGNEIIPNIDHPIYIISSIDLDDYYSCEVTSECGTKSNYWSTCGAYTDKNNQAWLPFMRYNLGVENNTLDPFSPAKDIHGAKYRFGVPTASLDMATDQSTPGAISTWNKKPIETGANIDWTTANNPCPTGWRLPTRGEWSQVISNNTVTKYGTDAQWTSGTSYVTGRKYGDALFLPAAGYRYNYDGSLQYRGSAGYYWSSTTRSSSEGYYLHVAINDTKIGSTSRAYGYSIRCVAK